MQRATTCLGAKIVTLGLDVALTLTRHIMRDSSCIRLSSSSQIAADAILGDSRHKIESGLLKLFLGPMSQRLNG